MVPLSSLMGQPGKYKSLPIDDRRRAVNASFTTAFRLAAQGEFIAAGAIYYVVMQREVALVEPEARSEIAKYRRQQGARKAREMRAVRAAATDAKVQKALAQLRQQSSNKAVADKAGVSTSTARRLRKKTQK